MGIFSGLFKSRDKPQNRTSGSNYAFFFGGTTSGKTVTERSAMQMTAVYSCVRILSEAVAGLPLHLYKYTDSGGKAMALDHPLYHLLHDEPNPEMSSFVFRETLMTHLLLWGNAYAQIMDYKGDVTVKIDGIAASAASVIAMAGTKVLVSPVSMLMIHNPMTVAFGNSEEMQRAIEMLGSVKDSIINAYEIKTGLSRAKLSHLMDAETWMDANKAIELGFADGIMQRGTESEDVSATTVSMLYSKANVLNSLMEKIAAKCAIEPKPAVQERTGRSVDELRAKLNTIKNYI